MRRVFVWLLLFSLAACSAPQQANELSQIQPTTTPDDDGATVTPQIVATTEPIKLAAFTPLPKPEFHLIEQIDLPQDGSSIKVFDLQGSEVLYEDVIFVQQQQYRVLYRYDLTTQQRTMVMSGPLNYQPEALQPLFTPNGVVVSETDDATVEQTLWSYSPLGERSYLGRFPLTPIKILADQRVVFSDDTGLFVGSADQSQSLDIPAFTDEFTRSSWDVTPQGDLAYFSYAPHAEQDPSLSSINDTQPRLVMTHIDQLEHQTSYELIPMLKDVASTVVLDSPLYKPQWNQTATALFLAACYGQAYTLRINRDGSDLRLLSPFSCSEAISSNESWTAGINRDSLYNGPKQPFADDGDDTQRFLIEDQQLENRVIGPILWSDYDNSVFVIDSVYQNRLLHYGPVGEFQAFEPTPLPIIVQQTIMLNPPAGGWYNYLLYAWSDDDTALIYATDDNLFEPIESLYRYIFDAVQPDPVLPFDTYIMEGHDTSNDPIRIRYDTQLVAKNTDGSEKILLEVADLVPYSQMTQPEFFTFDTYTLIEPTLAPDGSMLAWWMLGGNMMELWIANSDGSQPRSLITYKINVIQSTIYWSPDSTKLAYGVSYYATHLYVYDLATQHAQHVTDSYKSSKVLWDPTSRFIAVDTQPIPYNHSSSLHMRPLPVTIFNLQQP